MRVLVTGGAGRLGRSVVDVLRAGGHDVATVDLQPPPGDRTDWFPADLTAPGDAYAAVARMRPDALVHLAAIAVAFSRPEHDIWRTNTALAFNACQAAVDLGVGRVLVASSPTVIGYGAPTGWAPAYLPLDENHPVAPWNAYNLSKLVAEQVMAAFARQAGDRVRLAAFRPCFVIAPEEWAGVPTQAGHTIAERLERPEHAAVALFNYVDARDAGEFVAAYLDRAHEVPNGEVFLVGAPDALAHEPLAELLPRFHPAAAPQAAALAGTAPAFSSAKAERLLGWTAKRTWRTELVQ